VHVNKYLGAAVAAGVAALLIACGSGATNGATNGDTVGTGSTAGAHTDVTPAAAAYHTPVPADFTLTVKVLEKQCFGSAGCNITFRIDLSGGGELDPDKTYELTYEVKGGEDPLINTMTVTGKQYERQDRESIQTSSSSKKLTAVVTSVTER
jgi:hypothetical protein